MGVNPREVIRVPVASRAGFLVLAAACLGASAPAAFASCAPGWGGTVLISGDTATNWVVEKDTGSSGTIKLVPGLVSGQAIEIDWDLGTGAYVQAKYTFPTPVNLSRTDILGVTLRGGGPAELANTVGVMVADTNSVFYGYDMPGKGGGVNQVDRTIMNLPIPRRLLRFFFKQGSTSTIDWGHINRFYVVVKRPGAGEGGGTGKLTVDQLQQDIAAQWARQTGFEAAIPRADVASKAAAYILSVQKPNGLVVSWKEEPTPKAWLYDQALALMVFTREGEFTGGLPVNAQGRAAKKLADFLVSHQKADGHWSRGWSPITGMSIAEDDWVGDPAWCVVALAEYAAKAGVAAARTSASKGADWLATKIDAAGKLVISTEGNVDSWWAMVSTCHLDEAARIQQYLLSSSTVWDAGLRYWFRGFDDPAFAMDAATWMSAFVRHPLVNLPERGLAALSVARKALITSSNDGARCGFDGMGPVSVWNEGTAQYVAAGGAEADRFLDVLVAQQHADGSMPGSPDSWTTAAFGWLSSWSGIAPTSWTYFAVTGPPFPYSISTRRGDSSGDGQLDLTDPLDILNYLFLDGPMENGCGEQVADSNADGAVDVGDAIFLLVHLFAGGPPPPAPDPVCYCQ
jgi:hypothetical protein